jgi:hypothetical protein
MRRNIARGVMGESGPQRGPANTASFSFMFKSPQKINITTVLDREGRGHPGWPVRNLETKNIFFSQKQAAEAFNIPQNVLSGHLKGKFSDVDGLHFERVNLVPA